MTLEKLAATLKEQEEQKRDYIIPAGALSLQDSGELVVSHSSSELEFLLPTEVFHEQMSEKLGIPKAYYDRMKKELPALLSENVRYWLHEKQRGGTNYLLRTFRGEDLEHGTARALLSDRHHMIDNYLTLMETLQAIDEAGLTGKIEVKKCELTRKMMYVEFTCPDIMVEAPALLREYRLSIQKGTGIIAGFLLQNSEVGKGAFHLIPRAVFLACNNGAVMVNHSLKRIHLGKQLDGGFDFSHIKSVREANIALIREQLKYAVKHFMTREYVENVVKAYESMGMKEIEAPVNKVTQVIAEKYGWTEAASENLLMRFVQGGDTRRIGIYNAMTLAAQDFDADSKYDAEVAAWEVLNGFDRIEKLAIRKIMSN